MTSDSPDEYPHFCSICGNQLQHTISTIYVNPVCDDCDSRAVSEPGVPAQRGDNPVFIDGIRCFRRYKMGGWLSQRDGYNGADYDEFYATNYDDYGPIHTFNQPDPPSDEQEVRRFSQLDTSSEAGITARVIENDILEENADALICGITTDPSLDGGVAGAVCDASDYSLRPFIREKAPLQLGDVAVTGGFDLPYSYLVFVAATPSEGGEGATEDSVQDAVKNGLHQVADLRLPSVVIPLIGAGAGGLRAKSAASAVASGIRTSGVSPPICVRVVTRNPSDREVVKNQLPLQGSEVLDQGYSDPLEGKISARLECVDQSGPPADWEMYTWVQFDPYTGDISDYDNREGPDDITSFGLPKKVETHIEGPLSDFVEDYGYPEQWLARYDSFNSQMGGVRSAIEHPDLTRPLYSREQSLIGALRGLEHEDSEYSDILELILKPSKDEPNQTVARIRYRVPQERVEVSDDLADSCLQTSLRVVEYVVETLSHLDFDHPMSSTMEVERVDRIEIIAHACSQVAFELVLQMDIAKDLIYSNHSSTALRETSTRCEIHLD